MAALVYSRVDPERSKQAWTRYLASSVGSASRLTPTLIRMIEALTALDDIGRKPQY